MYSNIYAKRWNFFPGKAQGLKNRHREILLPSSTVCAKPLCNLPGELECWPCHTSSQERVTVITALHPAALCASAAGTETAGALGWKKSSAEFPEHRKKDWQMLLVGLGGTKNGQTNSLSRCCMRWQRLAGKHWPEALPFLTHTFVMFESLFCWNLVSPSSDWDTKPEGEAALDCSSSCSMW